MPVYFVIDYRIFILPHHERVRFMNSNSMHSQFSSPPAPKLWDSILKSIIHHMPEQLFPLLKHIFGKEYPKDTSVELLAAEYAAPGKAG